MATEYRNNAKSSDDDEHFPPSSPSLTALQPANRLPIFSRSSAVGSYSVKLTD
jgi:hypothetical protein